MGKYRIIRREQRNVELFGGGQYWREIEEAQAADLDLEEIAELNHIPSQTLSRRNSIIFRLGAVAIVLLVFASLIGLDALPYLRMPDLGFLSRSAELYKDEALASLKSAVVSIEGANSSGSGFNLRADGLIVSNRHVVENNTGIMVIFPDGRRYPAKAWQFIEGYDLAVASINGTDLPHVELGGAIPQVGDKLIFIGNPLGFDWTISEAQMISYMTMDNEDIILYFSGPVRSGSSGSPLFNDEGKVIGVIFASLRDVEDSGLAIPSQLLLSYVDEQL